MAGVTTGQFSLDRLRIAAMAEHADRQVDEAVRAFCEKVAARLTESFSTRGST